MNAQDYGEHYKEHLLKQYELYVQMADKVSDRRDKANGFYTSLLVGLFAFMSISITIQPRESSLFSLLVFTVSLFGMLLCAIWFFNIRSYRQLNSGKFAVIHRMEQELPFSCYDEEWTVLGRGQDPSKYMRLTWVESLVPAVLGFLYVILGCYSLVRLLSALVKLARASVALTIISPLVM